MVSLVDFTGKESFLSSFAGIWIKCLVPLKHQTAKFSYFVIKISQRFDAIDTTNLFHGKMSRAIKSNNMTLEK